MGTTRCARSAKRADRHDLRRGTHKGCDRTHASSPLATACADFARRVEARRGRTRAGVPDSLAIRRRWLRCCRQSTGRTVPNGIPTLGRLCDFATRLGWTSGIGSTLCSFSGYPGREVPVDAVPVAVDLQPASRYELIVRFRYMLSTVAPAGVLHSRDAAPAPLRQWLGWLWDAPLSSVARTASSGLTPHEITRLGH